MLTRSQVYEAIDSERDYQKVLEQDPGRNDGRKKTLGDYGLLLHRYLAQMDSAYADNPGDEQALNVIRKIAGIAVHCMEDFGAPHRVMPEDYRDKERGPDPSARLTCNVIPPSGDKPCELLLRGELWNDSHFWSVMNSAMLQVSHLYHGPDFGIGAPMVIDATDCWCSSSGVRAFNKVATGPLMSKELFFKDSQLGMVLCYAAEYTHPKSKFAGLGIREDRLWKME